MAQLEMIVKRADGTEKVHQIRERVLDENGLPQNNLWEAVYDPASPTDKIFIQIENQISVL